MAPNPFLNVVPSDLESLFSTIQTLQTENPDTYNAIVRPQNPPSGIGGFLFDIPGEEEVRLRSQITNYFLEDNTSIQDNIAREPAMIILRGVVAELILGIPVNPPTINPTTVNPLIPAFLPGMTPQQTQSYTQKQAAAAKRAVVGQQQAAANGTSQSLYEYYTNVAPNQQEQTRQTNAFLYFQQLWSAAQLVSVETPWGVWEQCGILDVRVIQSEKTKYATEFTITLQEMRFAQDATVQTGNLAGRASLQMSPQTQDGNAGQAPVAQSVITSSINAIAGHP